MGCVCKLFKLNNSLINNYKLYYNYQLIRNIHDVNASQLIPKFVNTHQRYKQKKRDHPYHNLYPWKSVREFTDTLYDNICYNDGTLIAIDKPWGIGIHSSEMFVSKRNEYKLISEIEGSPNYCIDESLELLGQMLKLTNLKVIKTVDRNASGIILIATNDKTHQNVLKSFRRAISNSTPFMTFLCITKGWPNLGSSIVKEKVGIKLVETDEFGNHKEPIIIGADKLTKSMVKGKPLKDGMRVKPVHSQIQVLDSNKSLSCSLVEVCITHQKWQFLQCYVSNKASFILGDIRFSRRVKDILGTAVSNSPRKMNFNDDYEPLPYSLSTKLNVNRNSQIPLMTHHQSILLPKYLRNDDLLIQSKKLPEYFKWTLKQLNLYEKINNNYD